MRKYICDSDAEETVRMQVFANIGPEMREEAFSNTIGWRLETTTRQFHTSLEFNTLVNVSRLHVLARLQYIAA